eukprot:Skav226955  [mRNA]  locus=scaffold51:894:1712:+ [translate_table: standard]
MGERFKEEILDRFPLTMTDAGVQEIADHLGWDNSFMILPETSRAKAKARAKAAAQAIASSQNVGVMLSNHLAMVAPVPGAPSGPVSPLPDAGPVAPSPVAHGTPVAPSPVAHGTPVAPSPVAHGTPVAPSPVAHGTPVAPVAPSPVPHGIPVAANHVAPDVAPVAPSPMATDPVAPAHPVAPTATGRVGPVGPVPSAAAARDPEWVCSICQSNDAGATEQIQCGHYFHTECLANWRGVSGVPVTHCPFRCHLTNAGTESTAAALDGGDFDII